MVGHKLDCALCEYLLRDRARARARSGHLRYPVAAIVSTRGRVRSVNLSRLIITQCAAMCGDVFAREQTRRRPAEAAGAVQVI